MMRDRAFTAMMVIIANWLLKVLDRPMWEAGQRVRRRIAAEHAARR